MVAYQPPVFSILPTQRCPSLTGFQASCRRSRCSCVDLPATKRPCCRIINAALLLSGLLVFALDPNRKPRRRWQSARRRAGLTCSLTHALCLSLCALHICTSADWHSATQYQSSHPRPDRPHHPFASPHSLAKETSAFSRDTHGAPALTVIPSSF